MPKSGDPLTYTHPPNYVNPPSNAYQVTIADSVGLALATILVAARCYTKFRITKAPGWEDCMSPRAPCLCLEPHCIKFQTDFTSDFSIMAWVVYVVYCSLEMIQRFHYGISSILPLSRQQLTESRRRTPSLRYPPVHVLWLFLGQYSLPLANRSCNNIPLFLVLRSLLTPS